MPDHDKKSIVAQIESEIPRLRRYARFLTRDVEHADDLVQDCLVRALTKIDTWQPGTNLRAWLITILRNGFYNDCRRASRERKTMSEPRFTEPQIVPAQQDAAVTITEVEAAFMSLSNDHREVMTLVAIEGLSYEQAANTLGVSIGTIKSRLARARTRLSDLLGDEDYLRSAN